MNKNNQIVVRLDDQTMEMWIAICATFKGSTRSMVFRNLLKRIHQASTDALKLNSDE